MRGNIINIGTSNVTNGILNKEKIFKKTLGDTCIINIEMKLIDVAKSRHIQI